MPPKKILEEQGHKTDDVREDDDDFSKKVIKTKKTNEGNRLQFSFNDIEKSMVSFSGDNTYPIKLWIGALEDTSEIMNWTDVKQLIYAKRLLTGTAKLFLRSLGSFKTWLELKTELLEEFGARLNSAIVHKKLVSRKIKVDETFQQYLLQMKEIAIHGNVEDEALMEYIIDGIIDSEHHKIILYGATNLKEFRKKLELNAEMKNRNINNTSQPENNYPSTSATRKSQSVRQTRCYTCGD